MRLRDLMKANGPNDGTRSLFESILIPEVNKAFKDWKKNAGNVKCVLVGGSALGFYTKPRTTVDADLLFVSPEDIPLAVEGFKRSRPGAFLHKETHVEIEVLSPQSLGWQVGNAAEIAKAIYDNARIDDGVRIASPSGLVVSKLNRFKLQDQADIQALYEFGNIDLSPYPIPQEWKDKFDKLVASF